MTVTRTYQVLTNLNCNLDCSYCYERKDARKNTPDSIELFLEHMFERDKGLDVDVTVDIIGGEPLLYPELVDLVCDKSTALAKGYGKKLTITLSTNGTLLDRPEVQRVLLKHKRYLNLGISIDGPKDVHDRFRVYAGTSEEKGCYDVVVKNLPWLFGNFCSQKIGVKATFTNETMQRYAECVKHLHQLGFTDISANLAYEEVADGDIVLQQMLDIAGYLAENPECNLRQLPRDMPIGNLPPRDQNYCGTCQYMTCIGFDNKVYGCNRFCTMGADGVPIGILAKDSIEPINQGFVREVLEQWRQFPSECMTCPVASVCATCVAIPYEHPDGVKAYLEEKHMCGWAYAVTLARHYLSLKSTK